MYAKSISLVLAFVAIVVTVSYVQAAGSQRIKVESQQAAAVTIAFELDKPIDFILRSDAVKWRENTYHLLQLHQADFSLDEANRLTALIHGSSTTFDDVEYTVHAAVFNADGMLLGTASTSCQVQRIWLGRLGMMQDEIELDFGRSKRFADAATVMLTISSMDVLTPDQWQE